MYSGHSEKILFSEITALATGMDIDMQAEAIRCARSEVRFIRR